MGKKLELRTCQIGTGWYVGREGGREGEKEGQGDKAGDNFTPALHVFSAEERLS